MRRLQRIVTTPSFYGNLKGRHDIVLIKKNDDISSCDFLPADVMRVCIGRADCFLWLLKKKARTCAREDDPSALSSNGREKIMQNDVKKYCYLFGSRNNRQGIVVH